MPATHKPEICIGKEECGDCIPACPFGAINMSRNTATINIILCDTICEQTYGHDKFRPCEKSCRQKFTSIGKHGVSAIDL